MRTVLAIATRELRNYFLSPIAYIVIAFFLLLSGSLFALILTQSRQASLASLIQNLSVLFLFVMPALSSRLISEEQRSGTIELLLTNPVHEWQIVVGKFLASLVVLLVMLLLTGLYPIFLFAFGNPDRGPIISGYLGALLQAAAFLSIGLWASSLSPHQVIAYFVGFGILLTFWLADNIGQYLGGSVGSIISYVSVTNHANEFSRGVINSKDVIYYLTVILAGLGLSTLAVQARRVR